MVGQHAVALLRHRAVERAHAGLDVRERKPQARARQRARKRRVGVAVDEREVGRHVVAATGSNACMMRADLLAVRARADAQLAVGRGRPSSRKKTADSSSS